jgi:hypothetical protein
MYGRLQAGGESDVTLATADLGILQITIIEFSDENSLYGKSGKMLTQTNTGCGGY